MVFLVGFLIVFGSVALGYKMHDGDLLLLWQPNEIIIILGAGIGSVLIANPWHVLIEAFRMSKCLLTGIKPYDKREYIELLLFSFNTFRLMKVNGMLEIESHIEHPESSDLFTNAPSLRKEDYMFNFVVDNLRILTMGLDNPYHFEDLIDKEIEVYTNHIQSPARSVTSLADSLPALGIVAAVLGVIVTMKSIAEPPEVLGSLIAAALVGTFTGVLLSYGLIGPIGSALEKYAEYKISYLESIKVGFLAYLNNNSPIIIAEYMRKSIPASTRPTFQELDEVIGESTKIVN
jgi:chemotaxis protein MotA